MTLDRMDRRALIFLKHYFGRASGNLDLPMGDPIRVKMESENVRKGLSYV